MTGKICFSDGNPRGERYEIREISLSLIGLTGQEYEKRKIYIKPYDGSVDGKWFVIADMFSTGGLEYGETTTSHDSTNILAVVDRKEDLPERIYKCVLELAKKLAEETGYELIDETERRKSKLEKVCEQ